MLKIETVFAKRREKAKERLEICEKCDNYNPITTQCLECFCYMNIKTLWPFADCPLNKWQSYKEEKNGRGSRES